MAGSGTVLRQALALGHRAIGFDMDPLAVLMSRVWTSPIDETALDLELQAVMKAAATVDLRSQSRHWHDAETRACAQLWFKGPQRRALPRLAYVIDRPRPRRPTPHRPVALGHHCSRHRRWLVAKAQAGR